MKQHPAILFKELHSEEVHEIISRPPHWLLHWGITCTLGMIVLGTVATWWIRYPDIVSASFTLTSSNAPRKILARTSGRLEKLLVSDRSHVKAGQAVLYSESTASHEQILKLDNELQRFYQMISTGNWAQVHTFAIHGYTQLGELQSNFHTFYQQFEQLKTGLADGYLVHKRELLLEDVNNFKAIEATLIERTNLQKRDLELANEELKVQKKLFIDKTIPILKYNTEKAKLLAREISLKTLASSLVQNHTLQTAKKRELLELDNTTAHHKSNTLQALQSLRNSIENWKQKYILYAPVAGKVSFVEPWQEQQSVTIGQALMTIELDGHKFQGLIKIPQINLGKIQEGQTVLVKLDGYPYREYGIIEGTLGQVASNPGKDDTYWGYVDLPNGLATRYSRQLIYKNGMKGTAEIITVDRSLAERLLVNIRVKKK